MILLNELLNEDGEAAAQAKQMGLISKGWGRWADPKTGLVTHKTDNGRLVAVDPQQQEPSGDQEPDLDTVAKDIKRSGDSGNVGMGSAPDDNPTKPDTKDAGQIKPRTSKYADANADKIKAARRADDGEKQKAKSGKLKRAQTLRQAWKQKGHAEARATLARDFPKIYALDVVRQQGKDLTADIAKDMKGPKGKNPQWQKQAAIEMRKHKARVAKITEMPEDTKFSANATEVMDKLRIVDYEIKDDALEPHWADDGPQPARTDWLQKQKDHLELEMDTMNQRRSDLDKLRADGDDTVSGMSGKVPRIVRR